MFNKLKSMGRRATLAVVIAATGLTMSASAEARDRYGDRGDNAAIAIGAGLVGLAIGAALADRDDRHYYDRAYYPRRRYVTVRDHPGHYYYYEGRPKRYYRDRYYGRQYGRYYNSGYYGDYGPYRNYRRDYYERRDYNRWEQGRRKIDRWYGRKNYDRNGYHRGHRNERRSHRHHWGD